MSDPLLSSTARLIDRLRSGEDSAREQLLARYLLPLRRWAHGRLPAAARDLVDTDDVVQNTMMRALSHLEEFEPRFEGALFAYLRRGVLNQIRDQARRVRRAPERIEVPEHLADDGASPLERVIGADALERFEQALGRLPAAQQEAVLMRIELGFSFRQIAEALGSPSEDAARKTVTRALARLAEEVGNAGGG